MQNLNTPTTTLDFAAALKAHADWKVKLRDAISSESELDEQRIAKDNVCALGEWLHNDEVYNSYSHLENYQECKKVHAKFHQEAAKIAKEINRKNFAKATQMLVAGSEYSQTSTDVALCLHSLRKDING